MNDLFYFFFLVQWSILLLIVILITFFNYMLLLILIAPLLIQYFSLYIYDNSECINTSQMNLTLFFSHSLIYLFQYAWNDKMNHSLWGDGNTIHLSFVWKFWGMALEDGKYWKKMEKLFYIFWRSIYNKIDWTWKIHINFQISSSNTIFELRQIIKISYYGKELSILLICFILTRL